MDVGSTSSGAGGTGNVAELVQVMQSAIRPDLSVADGALHVGGGTREYWGW